METMNADGTNVTALTQGSDMNMEPVWSPNGARIAFVGLRAGDRDIFVMNADGSDQHAVSNNPLLDDFPVWAPVK